MRRKQQDDSCNTWAVGAYLSNVSKFNFGWKETRFWFAPSSNKSEFYKTIIIHYSSILSCWSTLSAFCLLQCFVCASWKMAPSYSRSKVSCSACLRTLNFSETQNWNWLQLVMHGLSVIYATLLIRDTRVEVLHSKLRELKAQALVVNRMRIAVTVHFNHFAAPRDRVVVRTIVAKSLNVSCKKWGGNVVRYKAVESYGRNGRIKGARPSV